MGKAAYVLLGPLLAAVAATAQTGAHLYRVRVYRDREQFQQEAERGGPTTTAILLAAGVEVRGKGAVVAEARVLDDWVVDTTHQTGNSDKPDRH